MSSAHHYKEHFAKTSAVLAYEEKFKNSIEQLRHVIEREIIAKYARGALFDCSIGNGRFVGLLPLVSSYAGMDYSNPFLEYIRSHYPDVDVQWGDLKAGINRPAASADTVICLRTLFALGDTGQILSEMVRIGRPSAAIIFDYGAKSKSVAFAGAELETSPSDISEVLARLPVRLVEILPLDGLLTKMKRFRVGQLIARIAVHIATIRKVMLWVEARTAARRPERYLYILEKRER